MSPNRQDEIRVDIDPDAQPVTFGEGRTYALPERFSAHVEPADGALPIADLTVVVEGGRPVCEGLHVERRADGHPITGALLRRLPIGDYVRRAADAAARLVITGRGPLTVSAEGESYPLIAEPLDDNHMAVPTAGLSRTSEYRRAERRPKQRGVVTDKTLRKVAEVYREAYAAGGAPTKAVEDQLDVSRTTAGRWVGRARERGFLGPARPRVAGELDPKEDS